MTLLNSMLDNGQAQASPPGLAAVALIHPVEAFKNPVLGFLGNPDASIRHLQDRLAPVLFDRNLGLALFLVVADAVINQVVGNFVNQAEVGQDHSV